MRENEAGKKKVKVEKEEIKNGIELLKRIFFLTQEQWEAQGIDYSNVSKGSFARCDIATAGEKGWLKKRWGFLEKYDAFPEKVKKQADICFPLALKIFEFQAKKKPIPIDFSTLVKVFENRFTKIEISMALDILLDFMFIKYYTGKFTKKITSTGLIKFTAEIPEDMKTT